MLEHFEEDPLTTEKIKEAATNFRPAIMKDCIILEPPVTLIRKSDGKIRRADIIDERRGYWIHYSLNRSALEKARQRLNRICTCGCLPKSCHKK